MKIKILQLIEGAKNATGLTVIIDVFRAFSVACYLVNNGVKKIIPVGDIEIAYKLKKENPDFFLIGERGGKKQAGFDFGNSPTEIENIDFNNKTFIQTTAAGTQGIANAKNAKEIITCGFVNAQAVIDYIKMQNPKEVSLVAMGTSGVRISDEDTLCAEYIKNALLNKPNDFSKIKKHLKEYRSAQFFFDPEKDWAPEKDFELCLSLDKFNFILKVESDSKNRIFFKKL